MTEEQLQAELEQKHAKLMELQASTEIHAAELYYHELREPLSDGRTFMQHVIERVNNRMGSDHDA